MPCATPTGGVLPQAQLNSLTSSSVDSFNHLKKPLKNEQCINSKGNVLAAHKLLRGLQPSHLLRQRHAMLLASGACTAVVIMPAAASQFLPKLAAIAYTSFCIAAALFLLHSQLHRCIRTNHDNSHPGQAALASRCISLACRAGQAQK